MFTSKPSNDQAPPPSLPTAEQMDTLAAEYQDILLEDVEETGVELGRGSYGVVFEVKWRGDLRAAKKLHDFFFEPEVRNLPGAQKEVRNFKREFRSWAKLDHPNMVRLLGLYYNPSRSVRAPIIVMEKMDISLGDYIEKHTRQSFPLRKKAWVLLQVAQALNYLHTQSPPLVHHDLKPDNIMMMITSAFTTKLTDFGMIRAITRGSLTRGSSRKGTPVFMPPEAMEIPLRYDEQLDVFSYGVVVISTLVHDKAPLPSAPTVLREERQVAVSDFDRRRSHTDKFTAEEKRLFVALVEECLEFTPDSRPRSSQLVDKMSAILASLTTPDGAASVEESHSEAEYQSVLADRDALRKQCQILQKKLADAECELQEIREGRFTQKKATREVEQELAVERASKAQDNSNGSTAMFQRHMSNPFPVSGTVGGGNEQNLPLGWEARLASNGRAYFFNVATRQTSWDWPSDDM